MSRGAHPKLVVGFYEPVESEGVPKGFSFDDNLDEFAEFSSRKGRCDEGVPKGFSHMNDVITTGLSGPLRGEQVQEVSDRGRALFN